MVKYARAALLTNLACALAALACGGRIDPSSTEPSGNGSSASAAEEPSRSAPSTPEASAPPDDPTPSDAPECTTLKARCQIFEPGGPERWGCHSVGPHPELACERAAGASIARCNCNGHFGESPTGNDGREWFDIPATSTWLTDEEMRMIWKSKCSGVCR